MYQEFEPRQPKRPRWILYAVIAGGVIAVGVIVWATGLIPGLSPGAPAAGTETGDFFEPLATPSAAPATTVAPPFEITEETEEAEIPETEEAEAAETEPAATEAEEVAEVTAAETAAAGATATEAPFGTPLPNLTPTERAQPTVPTATLNATVATPTLIVVGPGQLTPTPTATPVTANFRRTMTFEDLGRNENIVLESPSGSDSVYFNFPQNWALSNTSTVEIQYDVVYVAPEVNATQQAIYQIPAVLEVLVDETRIATIDVPPASANAQRATIQLPSGPFNNPATGTYHEIVFVLDAGELCELPVELKVEIDRIVSVVNFDYGLVPPTADLSLYPRPFYNSSSFDRERVLIVLPDQPTLGDLNTAAAFSANLGSRSQGQLVVEVLRAGEVGSTQRTQTNMVLIGQPSHHALIQELYNSGVMPSQLGSSQVNLSIETSEDSPFDYNITLRNKTEAPLTNLTLEATLAENIQAETCSGGCRSSGELLVWAIPQLDPDEILSLSITIQERGGQAATANPLELVVRQGDTVVGMDNNGLTDVDKNTLLFSNNTAVALHEGLVEEIVSPFNPQMVILVFTGLSDEAVLQSVYGISSAVTPRYFLSGSSAVIREVLPGSETISEVVAESFTLEDLGYDDQTIYGILESSFEIFFDVPLNWELTDEALVRIEFSHSAAISEELSVLTVQLNQVPIGSVQLDRTNTQNGVLEVELPDSRMNRGGSNLLEITVDMDLEDECLPPDSQLAWATISRDSLIRLTHVEALPQVVEPTLGNLPSPFTNREDLSTTIMVLPEPSSSRDIQVMMQLANSMGSEATGALFSPRVTFASLLGESELPNNHLVLLGSPSTNEMFAAINDDLPQPFDLDNDTISQQAGDVIYRLPPGFSIGVAQIITSPFANPGSGFVALVISGSNEQGVEWARQAFIDPTIRNRLVGDLAYINNRQVENFDTTELEGTGGTVVAGVEGDILPDSTLEPDIEGEGVQPTLDPLAPTAVSVTATLPPEYDIVGPERPEWLDLATIVIGVIVLVILGVAFFTTRRRAKEQ